MNHTLHRPSAPALPLQTPLPTTTPIPVLDTVPLPVLDTTTLQPLPLRTGSVAFDRLLAREDVAAGEVLHLSGGRADVSLAIALSWVRDTTARDQSCVFLDLGGMVSADAVRRAGMRVLGLDDLAGEGVDIEHLGEARGLCRVACPRTWLRLNEVLDFVFDSSASPTLIVLYGLERLLLARMEGCPTPTNLFKSQNIARILVEQSARKCQRTGNTLLIVHSSGTSGEGGMPRALRLAVRRTLFAQCPHGLEIGGSRLQGKRGGARHLDVPLQPFRHETKSGGAATIELWQSGGFKNPE